MTALRQKNMYNFILLKKKHSKLLLLYKDIDC